MQISRSPNDLFDSIIFLRASDGGCCHLFHEFIFLLLLSGLVFGAAVAETRKNGLTTELAAIEMWS